MASCKDVDAVKVALSSGAATAPTVATLAALLTPDNTAGPNKKPSTATKTTATKTTKTPRTTKTGTGKSAKQQTVAILEDGAKPLSGKERYALATEIVNITLKALTDSSKLAKSNVRRPQSKDSPPSTPPAIQKKALQQRSENITPSPVEKKAKRSPPSPAAVKSDACESSQSTAECARLAFSFLRAANTQQLGVRELPKWQLESGMIAMVGKLISLGLDSLAVRELRVIKRRLEGKVPKAISVAEAEKEDLATLLQLDGDLDSSAQVLQLAISYQLLVLRVLATSRKPAVIEAASTTLCSTETNSPTELITRYAKVSKDAAKSARHLDSLSQAILGVCPSISASHDSAAIDRSLSPSPLTTFKLQCVALNLRQSWWKLAKHSADIEKELLDPFSKCLFAFTRRTSAKTGDDDIYNAAKDANEQLGISKHSKFKETIFAAQRSLAALAEKCGRFEESQQWAGEMNKSCSGLPGTHSRAIACLIKDVVLHIQKKKTLEGSYTSVKLNEIKGLLEGQIDGQSSDYGLLIGELAALTRTLSSTTKGTDTTIDLPAIFALAASFAQRFIRSWPDKAPAQTQAIIFSAIRHIKSTDSLVSWISVDSAKTFIGTGALAAVAEMASKFPIDQARLVNSASVALDRIIRALILKSLKSSGSKNAMPIPVDDQLTTIEKATLLEWQLRCAVEHSSRPKYQAALQQFIVPLFDQLAELYSPKEYPLRRTRVYLLALRLRQSSPGLLPTKSLEAWEQTPPLNGSKLAHDSGLGGYMLDIKTTLAMAQLFESGRPQVADIEPHLQAWHQIIESATTVEQLEGQLEDCATSLVQLRAVATYFSMLGEDAAALPVLNLAASLCKVSQQPSDTYCDVLIDLARQYIALGFSEKAGHILAQADAVVSNNDITAIIKLQYFVAYAEYFIAIDNSEKARLHLEQARELRAQISLESVPREDRRTFELLHGRGWLAQSQYLLDTGIPDESLGAAKRSVKMLNSVWTAIERGTASTEQSESTEPTTAPKSDVNSLTSGISKLNLKPTASSPKDTQPPNSKGAAFWPLVPLLCNALLHLSEIYAHHGLFMEADYYSQRAVQTSESVGAPRLMTRVNIQRSRLLIMAGKLEDAELCLESSSTLDLSAPSLLTANLFAAKAAIRMREGSLDDAIELYDEAEKIMTEMSSTGFIEKIEKVQSDDDMLAAKIAGVSLTANKRKAPVKKAPAKSAAGRTASKTTTVAKTTTARTARAKATPAKETVAPGSGNGPYLLAKRKGDILLEKAVVTLCLSKDTEAMIATTKQLSSTTMGTLRQRRLLFRNLMHKASVAMQSDFAFNILPESTLSFPAMQRVERRPSSLPSPVQTAAAKKTAAKPRGRAQAVQEETFGDLLKAARECLVTGHSASMKYSGMLEIHLECSMLSDVTMMLSATDSAQAKGALHSVRQALHIDLPRIHAAQCEASAFMADNEQQELSTPLAWPVESTGNSAEVLTAATFQEQYVDILPEVWTAVSLSLNEDASELYLTRYRSGQSPLILRLPFSRQKSEGVDDDEDIFDYERGKAELEEIIEISNYSCHNTGGMDNKGAKKNWWSEREALDKRLHELLINMENIWLGGFRSILSLRARRTDLLARFRKSMDDILGRYLPSRQATKGRAKPLALDSKVLELFIGLGDDQEGVVDLDEPLADLLYFVIDMLQFNGEQNAYDEIDFDSMIVDVADALRAYHEACAEEVTEDQHLILILDKRLQAFPWESMPCLEGASVSRVGSMLTIKERLDEMRLQNTERQVVDRASGTYILNPSSDLTGTQDLLEPSLSKLTRAGGSKWSSIVNIEPKEDQFSTALTDSAMVLYFGHGGGSQYIRPRTIKRLDKCSKVVWLMGCSSGAVTEHGELEPSAIPLSYLLAGRGTSDQGADKKCMSVVGTLWDVTDKDIDRFSLAVGEEWGLFEESESSKLPVKTPKKRERLVAPTTPQQATKTPKTPKARKTPAPAKTPSRHRSQSKPGRREVGRRSLVEAVARSRDACYLRYLNGAAPVVYGVPVYLGE